MPQARAEVSINDDGKEVASLFLQTLNCGANADGLANASLAGDQQTLPATWGVQESAQDLPYLFRFLAGNK
jgi:hypothetical protein